MTSMPRSLGLLVIGTCVAALLLGGLGYWNYAKLSVPQPKPPVDMDEVYRLNNQGIGQMEHFLKREAEASFRKVIDLAPEWIPGHINLGIALLNQQDNGLLEQAIKLFNQILQQHPDNPYAHYCLGIIFEHQGRLEDASPHFEAVTRIDPRDPDAWYHLGNGLTEDPKRAMECFRRALDIDPYLSGPIYGLAMALRQEDLEQSKALLQKHSALEKADWLEPTAIKYTEMGHYAEVIGRDPGFQREPKIGPIPLFAPADKFQVHLKEGTRWATAADFGKGSVAKLRAQIRGRFGAVILVLDYNRDDKPDLLLLGAVVENGQVRDLLLRNDGDGKFTDVTAEVGLAGSRPSLGCSVADFDNDGHSDLFITGIGEQHLFRNTGKGTFEDVTVQAGLDQIKTVCLGSAFVDLDQDGDLDLIVAQHATTAEEALAILEGKTAAQGPGLAVYLNVGEAPPAPRGQIAPLKPRFERAKGPDALLGPLVPVAGLAVSDLDGDRDVDVFVVADHTAPALVVNDRLLEFHRVDLPGPLAAPAAWNGALVLDANHDGRSDLLLVGPGHAPVFLLGQPAAGQKDVSKWFQTAPTNSPPLLQAQAIDLDYDGWTDVVGLSAEHKPVFLHNDGQRLVHRHDALGHDASWPKDLIGLAVAPLSGSKYQDLLVWSEKGGLSLYVNQGNKNQAVKIELSGRREVNDAGNKLRCNQDGIGAWVIAQADVLWTAVENTTLSAGLGQSRQPLVLGIGPRLKADVVRIRWPDNSPQAEFDIAGCRVTKMREDNRKETSCPLLFAWNGQRFGFVTDFLGAGSMGECEPDGGHRPPRPEESVKIESHQLVPRDGQYVLKIANPMDEVDYLDCLRLLVVDHPADVRVYPDERFTSPGPPASQDLLAFRQEIHPVRARDHHGRDVTPKLRTWDRDTVDDFAQRSWLGFAEEHWVELDFGDRLAKFGPNEPLILCLAGWTDYPYPESIWAAHQAGVEMLPPVLERRAADGAWQTVLADMGFPAGLPRMMTLDVTGKLSGPSCVIRLRTNLEIYWDQIFVAPLVERIPSTHPVTLSPGHPVTLHTACLEVGKATLAARGCVLEFSPDGRQPTIYDYDRLSTTPVNRPAGRVTRLGDVTELLREPDDRHVIFAAGEEVTVHFDARSLPELPAGWKRSFVLRTWGYTKDVSPFTATGDTVEPLPFRGMSHYPYGPAERYPHGEDVRRYHTRPIK